jgi:hypothetical protein
MIRAVAEKEWETVSDRGTPCPPVQQEEVSLPIANLMISSQFEIPFDSLHGIPKLGAPR